MKRPVASILEQPVGDLPPVLAARTGKHDHELVTTVPHGHSFVADDLFEKGRDPGQFFDHGLEMSRRFRGLKVWTILKARGADKIAEVIQHDIDLRRHLDSRIDAEPRLESLGSELSIACFRYVPHREVSDERLNAINQTIVETLVAEGRCYMSPTTLEGRYALRVCIVSFRTRREDVDFVVDEVLRIGRDAEGSTG